MTLLFVPFFVLFAMQGAGAMKWFFLAAPIVYTAVGYIFTALACLLCNVLAKRVGGIEFELSDRLEQTRPNVDGSAERPV